MRRSIAVVMIAMMTIGSFALIPSLASADTQFQGLWVRVGGIITQWGNTSVFGRIGAYAAMINANGTYHQWARAHAIWTTETHRLNCSGPPPVPENFTFSFYAAGLVETSAIKLNFTHVYISGLWNVIKITITILVDEAGALISFTRTFEPIVTNATGFLYVFPNPNFGYVFVLSIEGIDMLSGIIVGCKWSYWEIKICDVAGDDDKVTLHDLVKVAKSYRTVPGLWNYNHDVDFNFDNKIDMGDLTTVAANMES